MKSKIKPIHHSIEYQMNALQNGVVGGMVLAQNSVRSAIILNQARENWIETRKNHAERTIAHD